MASSTSRESHPPSTDDLELIAGPRSVPPIAPSLGGTHPVDSATGAQRESRPLAAIGWMLLACLLFAFMNLCAKTAMRELPWHEVAAGRAGFGALTIFLWARARGVPLVVADKRAQWLRTLAGICAMTAGFYTLSRLAMGDAVTLSNLSPLFLAIASKRALDERAGGGLVVAVILGFLGVFLLAGGQLHGGALFATAMGVVAALFSCVAMIFLRRLGPTENPEAVSFHFIAWAAVAMLIIGAGSQVVPSPSAATSLVLAGFTGGGAQMAMTRAYGLDKAARVGGVGYSGVVLSQLLGFVVLHEVPAGRQLGGAALVVLSGIVLVFGAIRDQRRRPAPLAFSSPQKS